MNWRTIITIAKKDIQEARQNKAVWLPILIVPIIFVLVIPVALVLTISSAGATAQSIANDPDLAAFLKNMPAAMMQSIAGLDGLQSAVVLFLGYMFAPFFLIMPLMYASVIAAESFAGERERKTIEALLYTPATDIELFLGKTLAAFIPALVITLVSFLAYTLVLNVVSYPLMQHIWFPLASWFPLIFWVAPAIALLGITFTVLISAKVQTFMGAYQSSGSLVVLVLGLLAGQATGVLYLSPLVGLLIGLVLWLVDLFLIRLSIKSFNREKLLSGGV
jgi:ABC-type Na+ efflux pump permease subunit